MSIVVKSPHEYSDAEFSAFEKLVIDAGEVQAEGFSDLLMRSHRLISLYVEGELVATGAIKNPRKTYKEKVFNKAKVSELSSQYTFEAGWIVVEEKHRRKGYSTQIVNTIVQELNGEHCFATVRVNNEGMNYIFSSQSFNKLGFDYESVNGDYSLGLLGLSS